MKKIFAAVLASVMMLSLATGAFAETDVGVYLNGERQSFNVRVEQIGDHTLVPMRPLLEMFGYTVQWDDWNKWVYCTSAQGKFLITLGIATAMNNGYSTPVVLSTYPRLMFGQTFIPKDFAEMLTGTSMQFSKDTNSLKILPNTKDGGALIRGSGYINK